MTASLCVSKHLNCIYVVRMRTFLELSPQQTKTPPIERDDFERTVREFHNVVYEVVGNCRVV